LSIVVPRSFQPDEDHTTVIPRIQAFTYDKAALAAFTRRAARVLRSQKRT